MFAISITSSLLADLTSLAGGLENRSRAARYGTGPKMIMMRAESAMPCDCDAVADLFDAVSASHRQIARLS